VWLKIGKWTKENLNASKQFCLDACVETKDNKNAKYMLDKRPDAI
jgi:hypothetical protein